MNTLKRQDSSSIVEELSEKYAHVLGVNFQRREQQLIKQLLQEARVLKDNITFFKKQTSSENIERLVNDKRRQKEKERQLLESRWRQCTQSFKKLQEEEKKLLNEQQQNEFDLSNLKCKIEEFGSQITRLKNRPKILQLNSNHFVTEVKQNYRSPYKAYDSTQQKILGRFEKEQRLLIKTQDHFFSKKYNLNLSGSLRPISKFSNSHPTPQPSNYNLLNVLRSDSSKYNTNELFEQVSSINLRQFLSDRQVRLKIFKFLKKQI